MRKLLASLLFVSVVAYSVSLQAQGPLGRMGPGGFRPPLPPIPVPGVFPGPGFVRVPGGGPVGPGIVAPGIVAPGIVAPRPGFGYVRPTTVVAVPVFVPAVVPSPYSTARVAVVQPAPSVAAPNPYRAGSVGYNSASQAATANVQTRTTAQSNDLRPGMVLPDGAIVVSVGQPTAQSTAQSTSQPSAQPARLQPPPIPTPPQSPTPAPNADGSTPPGTRSILEPKELTTEDLPPPQPTDGESAVNSKPRKF